ncbi:MAG: hypothetical protein Q8L26_01630 [Candidatus Omnitrophota bacterium]|nr:hypothetical protein [Candidatus Omnitrophota bacterium]
MRRFSKTLFLFGMELLAVFMLFTSLGHAVDLSDDSFRLIVSSSSQFIAKDAFLPGKDLIFLQLTAQGENKDKYSPDSIRLKLKSVSTLDIEEITLVETGNDTGVFQNAQGLRFASGHAMLGNDILQVSPTQDTIAVIYIEGDKEKEIAAVKTIKEVERFSVVANPIQTSGKPFYAEIIACDSKGNTLAGYSGKVSLEVEAIFHKEEAYEISPKKISSFINGKNSIYATYFGTGKIRIVARDKDNHIVGKSDEISFLPAKFRVKVSTPQIAGESFDMEVIALNFNNEVIPDYTGDVFVKSVNNDSIIKKNMRFSGGIAKTDIVMNSCGEEQFIVCDANYPDICGLSESIFFRPYGFKLKIDSPASKRKKFYFDEVFKGRIVTLDYKGREVSGYGGSAELKPIQGVDMPKKYYFDKNSPGGPEFSISGITDTPFRIEAYDIKFSEVKGESESIALMPAKVKTELLENKDNKAVLQIKIVDDKGEVVKEDNSTILTVYVAESIPDKSAFLADPKKIKTKNGMATFTIIDGQRETVSVTPISEYYYLETGPFDVDFK